MPKKKTDINRITAHLCSEIEEKGDSSTVAKVPLNVFRALYDIGMRENIQNLESVICPNCKEEHKIFCPECGKTHILDILDSSKEKNSIACLTIMSNKFFPNKAPVVQDFDQASFVEKITKYVSQVLSLLPEEQRKTYTEMWVKTIQDLDE